MLDWIIANKELIKIFYGLIIGMICAIIVFRTDDLYRISTHKGIRYFRNAFFFYGIAFITRYLFGALFSYNYIPTNYYFIISGVFEYFLVMAGFFLLYSLLWKKLETPKEYYPSSLLNTKIAIFYFMSFVIVFLDYLWQTYSFMFFSQIIIFASTSIISYLNYKKNGSRHKFLKFYFIAMLLSLTAWILNALAALYFNWDQGVMINVYILNMIIFLLFLWGVINVTKR